MCSLFDCSVTQVQKQCKFSFGVLLAFFVIISSELAGGMLHKMLTNKVHVKKIPDKIG